MQKDYGKIALDKFLSGYNCAQAVICTFCEELGMKEDDLFRLTEGMGGGMGGMKDTCGAVSSAYMVASFASSAGKLDDPRQTKKYTYSQVQELNKKFCELNGSVMCRDIKGDETLPMPLETCKKFVKDAAELAAEMLKAQQE